MKILSFSTLKTAFSAGIVVALLGTTVGCTVTPRHDGQRVYYPNGQHQGNGKYNNNGRYNNNSRYDNNHYRYK